MKQVLVDTSVWIDYFCGGRTSEKLDSLIDNHLVCTNKIIICELFPFLYVKKENELIDVLKVVPEIPLNINWDDLIVYQTNILKNNYKRVGIPDLIILDNIIQNDLVLFTLDKPLLELKELLKFKIV
jgi:predicted nucleic acid-binding protein